MSEALRTLPAGAPRLTAEIPLGMAQLGIAGLSENWWLKHFGDVHWSLIAQAMGQEQPLFRDPQGRPLYAAFCATDFQQATPGLASLGQQARVTSHLWQAGRNRLQSNHSVKIGGQQAASLRMISTFVTHEVPGVNGSVCRAAPAVMPVLTEAPDDFARTARADARRLRARPATPASGGQTCHLRPCPATDFNAVGLLYFPSYALLVERANSAARGPLRRRRVSYVGNVEIGDTVTVRLSGQPGRAQTASLSDPKGRLLAAARSEYHA